MMYMLTTKKRMNSASIPNANNKNNINRPREEGNEANPKFQLSIYTLF